DVLLHELSKRPHLHLSCLRDSLNLIEGRRRADVRVEAAGRGRDEIDRNGRGVSGIRGAKRVDPRLDRLDQVGVGGTLVRSRRRAGVVAEWARRRRPSPEVLRIVEWLADEL